MKTGNAYYVVQKAIADGKLQRGPCEVCGKPKADAHHDDYSKPLEIRWLCHLHHHQWHANNVALNRPAGRRPTWGRPELGKITTTVRLRPKTNAILERVVAAINGSASAGSRKLDKSTYIENLLLAKFKEERHR